MYKTSVEKWSSPKLTVIVRSKPNVSVLESSKDYPCQASGIPKYHVEN